VLLAMFIGAVVLTGVGSLTYVHGNDRLHNGAVALVALGALLLVGAIAAAVVLASSAT
jgi:hypothetical protein